MRKVYGLLFMLAGFFSIQATPVVWYLNGVTFNDGGSATGSFIYDSDTNTYSSIKVFTTPGTAVTSATSLGAGGNYTEQSPGVNTPTADILVSDPLMTTGVTRGLRLVFAAPLTNGGGSIPLNAGVTEGICNVGNCLSFGADFRVNATGSVVALATNSPKAWYLRDMRFDDGGQAIGSFVYDAETNTYSNIDIWVTAGSTFATSRHYVAQSPIASAGVIAVVVSNPAQAGDRILLIATSGVKTNAAATLNIGGGGTVAEESCASVNCTVLSGPLRLLTSGLVTTVRPPGYAAVLSDIVDGSFGGSVFQTTVIATNLTDQPVAFSLDFFQDNGSVFNVPGIGANSVRTVPARGTLFLSSTGGGGTRVQGWARARGAAELTTTASSTNKNANAGGDVQNVVASEPVNTATFSMAFDNTGGAVGGFALTNPDPAHAFKVLAVAYDNAGNILLNDSSITLNPLSHTAFNFQNQAGYSALANKRGLLRIFSIPASISLTPPLLGLDGLLIRFLPNSSTATVQAVHQ